MAIRSFSHGRGPKKTVSGGWSRREDGDQPLAAGVPLDDIIPRKFIDKPELVVLFEPRSAHAERYRRVISILENETEPGAERPQVITVTSALPEEGKTTTATNLALAFAENKEELTVLLDADLRRPTVSRYLLPEPEYGLSEVLEGKLELDHAAIRHKESGLVVVPAGRPDPNPLRLLRSERFAKLVAQLRSRFAHVVIDTPPSVPFSDASIINGYGDGALLVVRAARTPRSAINKALEGLAGGTVLGAVLNDLKLSAIDRRSYGYDEYHLESYYQDKRQGGK